MLDRFQLQFVPLIAHVPTPRSYSGIETVVGGYCNGRVVGDSGGDHAYIYILASGGGVIYSTCNNTGCPVRIE